MIKQRRDFTLSVAYDQADLEAYEDVGHLLLGESVAQALEARGDCCLPTQLACTTQAGAALSLSKHTKEC